MRLKAVKGLPAPRMVSRSSSVAVSPPDMQRRCVAGSWGVLWQAVCPPVLMQQNGLYRDPIWKLGQPEHFPYREHLAGSVDWFRPDKPVWSPAALSAVYSCHCLHPRLPWAFPITCGKQMFTPRLYSRGKTVFPPSPVDWDVKMLAVIMKVPCLPLGCNDALGLVLLSSWCTQCTPRWYWHSLNWWTPLVPSSCQTKSWLCTKLGLRS